MRTLFVLLLTLSPNIALAEWDLFDKTRTEEQFHEFDGDAKGTAALRKTVEAVSEEVATWKITEDQKRYLLSALATHEYVLAHHCQMLDYYQRGGARMSPELVKKSARGTAQIVKSYKSNLFHSYIDPRTEPKANFAGTFPEGTFAQVVQIIDDDTFHAHLRYGGNDSDFRLIFDGFKDKASADGQKINLSGVHVVIDSPQQYESVGGGTVTAFTIKPLKTDGLEELTKEVGAFLKNPVAAKKVRDKRLAKHQP